MRWRAPSRTLLVLLLLTHFTLPAQAASEGIALRWSAVALEAVRQSGLAPPAVARALAIVHTCLYDAWAAYDPVAAGVHYHVKALAESDEEAAARAVSYAAYRALNDVFPGQQALFDGLMAELGYGPLEPGDVDGALGVAAAEAGLAARAADGSNQRGGYADDTGYSAVNPPDTLVDPYRWQPLVLANGSVQTFQLPQWPRVMPFALRSADQFRPPPPMTFPDGLFRKQALALLHLSAGLTDRDKAIATYWSDGPRTETPPGHWYLLAMFVSRRDGHTLEQDVKLFFALTNALMDAGIAAWDAKVHYDYVRPITAIRFLFGGQPVRAWAGPGQGTALITGDRWTPYIPTPPFAEYVSGHSTFSAAAAEVLRLFTGSDEMGAQVRIAAGSSPIEPGLVPRRDVTLAWRTFTEAADEAGLSRRYGGIHFEDGDLHGRILGRRVGALVWERADALFAGTRPMTP